MATTRRTLQVDPSQEAVDDLFYERGWSDGLPIVAPTLERVERILASAGYDPDEVIGPVPVSNRILDMETLAANAVMAGCRSEHLPLLRAAVEAVLDPAFNLAGVTATTHPAAPLLLVSGPIRHDLGLNFGSGSLGPGCRPSAVVGRALRLILMTVGDGRPSAGDRSTHGHPGKYTYVAAEHEEASGWESLRVREGFGGEDSTVTVLAAEAPRNVNDHGSQTAVELVLSVAGCAAAPGHNNLHRGGPVLIILGPEHAAILEREGLGWRDVQQQVFDVGQIPLSKFGPGNLRRFRNLQPEAFAEDSPSGAVPVTRDSSEIIVFVSGGPGRHSMIVPTFGTSRAVTRPIAPADRRAYRN